MDNMKLIIGLFITAIIGVILVSTLSDQIWANRNPYLTTNESVSLETARDAYVGAVTWDGATEWNGTACDPTIKLALAKDIISGTEVRFDNNTLLTAGTDYDFDLINDEIYFYPTVNINQTDATNTTYVSYSWSDTSYVKHTSARTLLGLVILFFVIGIAFFVIGSVMGWDKFKDMFSNL